jgi:hypothetical protein
VHAFADQLHAERARIGCFQAPRRQVHAVGARGQRHVGAVIDEEGRLEFRADLAKPPGPLQKQARRNRLAQLHSSRPARQHG